MIAVNPDACLLHRLEVDISEAINRALFTVMLDPDEALRVQVIAEIRNRHAVDPNVDPIAVAHDLIAISIVALQRSSDFGLLHEGLRFLEMLEKLLFGPALGARPDPLTAAFVVKTA